jgi:hypothetical protein
MYNGAALSAEEEGTLPVSWAVVVHLLRYGLVMVVVVVVEMSADDQANGTVRKLNVGSGACVARKNKTTQGCCNRQGLWTRIDLVEPQQGRQQQQEGGGRFFGAPTFVC